MSVTWGSARKQEYEHNRGRDRMQRYADDLHTVEGRVTLAWLVILAALLVVVAVWMQTGAPN